MRWTTFAKLLAGCFVLGILLMLLTGITNRTVSNLKQAQDKQAAATYDLIRNEELLIEIKSLQELTQDYLTSGRLDRREEFEAVRSRAEGLLDQLRTKTSDPAARELWDDLSQPLQELIETGYSALSLESPIGNPLAVRLVQQLDEISQELVNRSARARQLVVNKAESERNYAVGITTRTQVLLATVMLLVCPAGIGLAIYLSRAHTRPILWERRKPEELPAGACDQTRELPPAVNG